jgi:hypothetical protein
MNERLTDERHRIRILPVAPSHIPESTPYAREEIEPDTAYSEKKKSISRNKCRMRDQYDELGTRQSALRGVSSASVDWGK